MSNTELIAELRRGDGNGCKHANELMSRAADALDMAIAQVPFRVAAARMVERETIIAKLHEAFAANTALGKPGTRTFDQAAKFIRNLPEDAK